MLATIKGIGAHLYYSLTTVGTFIFVPCFLGAGIALLMAIAGDLAADVIRHILTLGVWP